MPSTERYHDLTHRVYQIWLAELCCTPEGLEEPETARGRRAADLFYLRTGEDCLSYHVRIWQG